MRTTKLFSKTIKNISGEIDSINAKYLIQGGFIDQVMAGVYNYLPLGIRVIRKIENIIREEMDEIADEVLMPILAPEELWEKTKRNSMNVLLRAVPANEASKKNYDASYIINPSQEELVTPLAQKFNISYKDLPKAAYQVQIKFRNEARPKSGLLRGREFRMKDGYSFHTDKEDLMKYYENSKTVYNKIFDRLGIGEETCMALASGGDFTNEYSHEFQTRCDTGEDTIFYDENADIYYNREVTPSKAPIFDTINEEEKTKENVKGENIIGVEKLAKFLDIEVERTTKTLLYKVDDEKIVAVALRGDYDVNEIKLRKILDCKTLKLASKEDVLKVTGAEVGYAGPLNLSSEVEIYWDDSIKGRKNFECGANKTDYHTVNVNFGRDIEEPKEFFDFKIAKDDDINPATNKKYEVFKASEVGNIFVLNTKYTDSFDYNFIAEDGKPKRVYMGCYGIGTSRVMGIIVERFHDEKGIIWPKQVAPFQVHLLSVGKDEEVINKSDELYKELREKGIEVLYDDRKISPGKKFGDSDLLGIPLRIVVSGRTLEKKEWG